MKTMLLGVLALATTAMTMTGCAIEDVRTEIQVRDPSRVVMRNGAGDVLQPGSRIASGRMPTGDESTTAWEAQASARDRAIAVDWSTGAGTIRNGEHHVILPANGSMTVRADGSKIIDAAVLQAPSFVVRWCSTLTKVGDATYEVEPRACVVQSAARPDRSDGAVAEYSLEIPWDDVRVVEHRRPDKAGAWLVIGVATTVFGGLSALAFSGAIKDHGTPMSTAGRVALGSSIAAVGFGYDMAMVPTLVASDRDVVVYEPRRARAQPSDR